MRFFLAGMSASCSVREGSQELRGGILCPAGQDLASQGLSHQPQPGSKAGRGGRAAQSPGQQASV